MAEPILLTDVVDDPAMVADALYPLIGNSDPRSALRALARARLPELTERQPGMFQRLYRWFAGGRPRSSAEQMRLLMHDLTAANYDAVEFVASSDAVQKARLETTTTPLLVAADQEETRTKIARHRSERAFHEQPPARLSQPERPPWTTLASPAPDTLTRADLEVAIRSLVESNTKTVDQATGVFKTALGTHRTALDAKVETLRVALGDIDARVGAFEEWTHTAAESQQTIAARLEERSAETAALAEQLDALQQPAVLRANERERELAEADHLIELTRKRAEISAHQAVGRKHRERPKSPAEEFAQRARAQLHNAKSKRRTLDKIRGEVGGRLRQTAERYGESSEEYTNERDMYDELTTDLEELK